MSRVAGHRGRLPKRAPGERFNIGYVAQYAELPAPVYPVDVTGGVKDWNMLGNGPDPACTTHPQGVGDCTFAGRQHNRMAKAAAGHLVEVWETSDALVAEYLQYDNGVDQGAVIADLLLYWYRTGKIAAFAPVDHSNPAELDAAMQAFHGLYCGVYLTEDADELFQEGKPWGTGTAAPPDPNEGHCIVKVGADPNAAQPLDTWVTWGALQQSTTDWSKTCLDEAWVIITAEDAEATGLDIAALRADIEALHGTGGTTGSLSGDSKTLLTKLVNYIHLVEGDIDGTISDVIDWLHAHGLGRPGL
jgi:hypothetical protein